MTDRRISSVLVANRGEIACRVFRTCAELGIGTVAVYSDADADAVHRRSADVSVRLPGRTASDTYLDAARIIDAARLAGADAIHPGYGFLSESAQFAQAVIDAGLVWIGPPPAAIASMGSKLASKALMRGANVPVLADAAVDGLDHAGVLLAGEQVGFPLLVKASAGGGGRGMRIVESLGDLAAAVTSAAQEAASAFGDGTVFLERYVTAGRHVEIQVVADEHGHCVSLFERECSIQRRHQKIIEESPSPAVDADLRQRMGAAAIAAARAVDYVGVGTVEFLLDDRGVFSFLEMNTRLQVEHPVTELVTGLDLVALQITVAEGQPLPADAMQPWMRCHAIEARLYAEDPDDSYRPSTGTLHRFHITGGPNVRVDSGVTDGSTVSPFYDPMLAKVVAWGNSRVAALRTLASALERAEIHGVVTNRRQLVEVLRHPEFVAGRTDTAFLARHALPGPDQAPPVALIAAAWALQAENRRAAQVQSQVPSGWRNVGTVAQHVTIADSYSNVTHHVEYLLDRRGSFVHLNVDGTAYDIEHIESSPGNGVAVTSGGRTVHIGVHVVDGPSGRTMYIDSPGANHSMVVTPRFAQVADPGRLGSLVSPMPGVVVAVEVGIGHKVAAGQTVVTIEAMKMRHDVTAPTSGVVSELFVEVGRQLDSGDPLLRIASSDSSD